MRSREDAISLPSVPFSEETFDQYPKHLRRTNRSSAVTVRGTNRGVVENLRQVGKRTLRVLSTEYGTNDLPPFERRWSDCEREGTGTKENKCPHARCEHHLAAGPSRARPSVVLAFGSDDPDDWPYTCQLREVEHGGLSQGEVGARLNVTHTRVQQLEASALSEMRAALIDLGYTREVVQDFMAAFSQAGAHDDGGT